MTDEQQANAPIRRQGRRVRGELVTIYARVSAERNEALERIRAERGWTVVTAIERAIDALIAKEGG